MSTSRPLLDATVFESFYLRVDGGPKRRASAIALIRRAVGKGGKAKGKRKAKAKTAVKVERLGADGKGYLVTPAKPLSPGAAWQKARQLQDLLAQQLSGTYVVEPLFAVTRRARGARGKRAKSSGSGKPLPCAATDCDWSLDNTHVHSAWALTPPAGGERMGKGILIGHPDTGYTRHDELFPKPPGVSRVRLELGYDFQDDDPDPRDPLKKMEGHGTGTASVIMSDAGGASSAKFVTGVAPAAELVPLRVSNGVVHFSFGDVTRAIHHAVDKAKVHVISMSLGGPFGSHALEDAVDRAIANDIVVLAAAGNEWPYVVWPAKYGTVIAVAATNCQDRPWSASASGEAVDLSAPGESVWRAFTKKTSSGELYDVGPSNGTSYAVATVAGACALWLAFFGRDALIKSAGKGKLAALFDRQVRLSARVPSKWKPLDYGAGILDALELLRIGPSAAVPKHLKTKAKGMAKASTPRDPAMLVGEYFAPKDRARALARLDRRLGATPTARARAWKRLGPELVFHVATDEELRRKLAAPAPARKGKGKSRRKAKTAAPVHVQRASSELRSVLET